MDARGRIIARSLRALVQCAHIGQILVVQLVSAAQMSKQQQDGHAVAEPHAGAAREPGGRQAVRPPRRSIGSKKAEMNSRAGTSQDLVIMHAD